jgi:nickel-dependent lactate racemase
MEIILDYGTTGLTVDLPDRATVIEPVERPAVPDAQAAIDSALRHPIGTPPLEKRVAGRGRIGISVCDVTRAQPREVMIRTLVERMPGVTFEDLTLFVATGTHRANTPEELDRMLGPDIARRARIVCHNARDESSLRFVGETSTGVPVFLNAEWLDCDFRITTGFVEPHFFAGFSGGPKMVAPGLAGIETVMHLHDARRIGSPRATFAVIEGNPVHDDVREIARMAPPDFSLDVTLNRAQQITAVFAGELFAEHRAACRAAHETAMRPVSGAFDVVVTTNSGYPLDQNLYQAVKGMTAAARILKPGGTIVCAAECRDGLPDHGAFGEVLRSRETPEALLEMIMAPGYSQPDQWQVQLQAMIQVRARVLVKCDGVSPEVLKSVHLESVDDVSTAVRRELAARGPSATLCVLPQGPQTIPYVPEGVAAR